MVQLVKKGVYRTFIGIDPGSAGGLATIDSDGKVVGLPMPKTRSELWTLLNMLVSNHSNRGGTLQTIHAVIERVHSMPSQSAQSGFTFGMNFERPQAFLTALSISLDDVPPQQWMKVLNIPYANKGATPTQKKEKLRLKAQQMFPFLSIWNEPKTKGKQLAICDALLLAHYCRLQYSN